MCCIVLYYWDALPTHFTDFFIKHQHQYPPLSFTIKYPKAIAGSKEVLQLLY